MDIIVSPTLHLALGFALGYGFRSLLDWAYRVAHEAH